MASSAGFDSPANTNPARLSSIFRNRFSNASLSSLSSVRTFLPQYSVVDTLDEQSTSPRSDVSTDNRRESLSRNSIPSSSGGPMNSPPRYSLVPRQSLILTRKGSTATPFEIDGDPQAHEFRYSYPIRPKKPWATLHLHTRDGVPGNSVSLHNQPRVPRFWSCDPITGTLQLDLDSPQNIQQINITLNGSVILSSHSGGSLHFLDYEFTLWEKSMGEPLQSDNADSKRTQKERFNGRLGPGQYNFPFSFPFPTHVDPLTKAAVKINSASRPHTTDTTLSRVEPSSPPLYDYCQKPTEKSPRTRARRSTSSSNEGPSASTRTSLGSAPPLNPASSMPQTFMEKDINPNIAYDISIRIVHGIFKASSRIKTNIAYIPASEPLPASQKRREAYEAGGLLPCPMDDPEGWLALPASRIYGVVKINENLLPTRIDCTLYIAQPLSYTRGSVIPCFITISSDGVEVEHITERPAVRLLRRVHHPMAEYQEPGPLQPSFGGSPGNAVWVHVAIPSDMKLVTHEVGHAKWWIPSKEIVQGPNVRHFEGEVHLSPDLQPSCDFQHFRVEYAIELLSFETANFKPDIQLRQGDNVIASSPVQITTLYREDEPVPTTYSEPPKTYKMRSVTSNKDAIFEEAK